MMRYYKVDYYIGWMSAASIFGVGHHAPQVFQVATSRAIRNRVIGRSDIRFYQRDNVGIIPSFLHKTQTGNVHVTTRAATMLSITNDLNNVAGLNNATNLIIELSETENDFIFEIVECADQFPISALRRLGWILENFTETKNLEQLIYLSKKSKVKLSKLSSYKNYADKTDKTWSLDINERVSPDI